MIAVHNISKAFERVQALQNVSFELKRGELCGLLGPNGAGKSTLFNITMGLQQPDQGQIYVNDTCIDFGEFAYKQDIGYAPESPALYEYLSGFEFLNFVANAKQIPNATRCSQVEKWLSFFKLEDKAHELVRDYSHGMRRKLSLSAAIIGEPKLLLLDEATNGLDAEMSFNFKTYLRDFCSAGGTVLFSSHIIETIENLCDRIIILHQGIVLREMLREDWENLSCQGTSLEEFFIKLINEKRTPN